MENYRRVRLPRTEVPEADPSEVLVTAMINPVELAREVKTKLDAPDATITLKGMGQAIGKAVSTAELLKRHVPGLHQLTVTSTVTLTDIWEPTVEGLERIETKRFASAIEITLSKKPLDAAALGYQVPLDGSAVAPDELAALEASLDIGAIGQGRGGLRGSRPGRRGSGPRGERMRAPHGEAGGDEGADRRSAGRHSTRRGGRHVCWKCVRMWWVRSNASLCDRCMLIAEGGGQGLRLLQLRKRPRLRPAKRPHPNRRRRDCFVAGQWQAVSCFYQGLGQCNAIAREAAV